MKRPQPGRRPTERRVHGDVQQDRGNAFDGVHALVRRIPKGRVMTYGQIATSIENRLSARAVGWAMNGCPEDVPWQRVVNARGGCSTERLPDLPGGLQQAMLEQEGVEFSGNGTLDLERYRWLPPEERPVRRKRTPRK
ncbi:MAG: methyltransferase [bacterium]|nr:methyltransferase [bacterium]